MLAGSPILELEGTAVELAPDEGAFIAVGAPHSWRNPGSEACRWIDLQAPQARPEGAPPARHAYCFERDWAALG